MYIPKILCYQVMTSGSLKMTSISIFVYKCVLFRNFWVPDWRSTRYEESSKKPPVRDIVFKIRDFK